MMDTRTEILNLLHGYAERLDAGDFEGVAALFRHAQVKSGPNGEMVGEEGLLAQWREWVHVYPDGTPRTKHVVTNPILHYDEVTGTATCRSYYTVLQATGTLPLQVVAAGRYHDAFEKIDGAWRFSARDYTMLDLTGALQDHLKIAIG